MNNNPWDKIEKPNKDIKARRIDHNHPFDFFWAKDFSDGYLFIFKFAEIYKIEGIKLPNLSGIDIYNNFSSDDEEKRLVLKLKEKNNWEIFLNLSNDLLEVTKKIKNSSDAIKKIISRLNTWQEFLKRKNESILSDIKIRGLIGELLFLKKNLLPYFEASIAINSWKGAEGFPQDFNINNSAIEVKCKLVSAPQKIRISSAEQLYTKLDNLYLCVVVISETDKNNQESINLPKIIFEIKEELLSNTNALERFNDLLHKIGYFELEEYKDFKYIFVKEEIFRVSEGFPRICPSEIHKDILELEYTIKLIDCKSFEEKLDWIKK